jgi:class 3 adenylate cyclase
MSWDTAALWVRTRWAHWLALKALRTELIDPKVAEHSGRVFKSTGDGLLAEFPSVVNANVTPFRVIYDACQPASKAVVRCIADPQFSVAGSKPSRQKAMFDLRMTKVNRLSQ